jgi:hypothetical protein
MLAVIEALSPRRPSAAVLAALVALVTFAVLLLLPAGAWPGAAVLPVVCAGIPVAEARRSACADLPRVRHVPGE